MSKWSEYNLDEVYEFASGLSKSAKDFGFGDNFLSYTDIFHNYFVPNQLKSLVNSTEKEQKSCSIKRGDVFLTRTSETDEDLGMSSVALKDYPKATFNGFTKRLRPNGKIDVFPEFAGFYFRSPRFRASVSGMSSVTTRASLNNGMLAALKILLPDINEQKRIANTLGSLHIKIDLLHRQNETLEALAETIFRQWFVVEAGESWEQKTLGEIADIKAGGDKPKVYSEIKTEDCNIPIYSNGIKSEGLYGYTDTARINIESITVSARGTIGFVCLRQEPYVPIVRLLSIVPKDNYLSSKYLYLWAKSQNISGTGTTQEQLTVPDFSRTTLVLPPTEKLKTFNELITPLFEKIKSNAHQIKSLTQLRDTLLSKLMTGEVRVESVQEEVELV